VFVELELSDRLRRDAGQLSAPPDHSHCQFSAGGDSSRHPNVVFGSMPNARKGADLRRDPRLALHSATVDPVEGAEAQWPAEAKISGQAIAAGPTSGPDGDRFHADIAEVVLTHLNEQATMLIVEWWTPTQGLRMAERE
jgi:hypothetical protein